jgi:hypothetical protein
MSLYSSVAFALQTLPTSVRLLEPAELDTCEVPEFTANYAHDFHQQMRLTIEMSVDSTWSDSALLGDRRHRSVPKSKRRKEMGRG